jgi:LysM repeat protein
VVTLSISRGTRTINPRTVILGDTPRTLAAHPKALLVAEGGPTFVFPLAPLDVDHDGYAPEYSTLEREGRKGLIYLSGQPLETMSFSCTLKHPGDVTGQVPIEEDIMEPLRAVVRSAPKFTIQRMGFTERGIWGCTGMKFTTTARQHGSNLTTRATVAFSFLEYVTTPTLAKVGPVTGGAVVPPAVPAPAAPSASAPPAPQSYVVVRGDTLLAISTRFYGSPNRWKDIATRNKLRNANLIYPGQRLVIPRP